MPSDADDRSILDSAQLLRRIHPDQVIDDKNTGAPRPSSGAFKDPEMSVDVESMLEDIGLDWKFSLRQHPSHSLVRFSAGVARKEDLKVVHKPIVGENDAHAEVIGKKSPGIANRLRDASSWVFIKKMG